MGLDIFMKCDLDLESHLDMLRFIIKYGLSRNFCNVILSDANNEHVELLEVGKAVGLDLTPLIEMGYYQSEADELSDIKFQKSDKAKQALRRRYHKWRQIAQKDVEDVRALIHELIIRINQNPDFVQKIRYGTWGHRDYPKILRNYFSEISMGAEVSCIDNNFREDLRNLHRYLDYVISKGGTKVWFEIG